MSRPAAASTRCLPLAAILLMAVAMVGVSSVPAAAQDPCIYGCVDPPSADTTPPAISIAPNGGAVNDPSVSVTVGWCDTFSLDATTRVIKLNGTVVTSNFDYVDDTSDDCSTVAKKSVGTVSLNPGSNSFYARICDDDGNCASESVTFTYDTYSVDVTPDGQNVSVSAGTSKTVTYSVQNNGSASASYSFIQSCSGTVSGCSLSKTSASLSPGGSTTVNQTFNVGGANTTGQAKLRASKTGDTSWSNWGSFDVSVPHVYSVSTTPDGGTVRPAPNSSQTQSFTVTNTGSDTATYEFTAACTPTATDCTIPSVISTSVSCTGNDGQELDGMTCTSSTDTSYATLDLAPGQSGTIEVGFDVGGYGTQGEVRLTSTDQDRSAVSDDGWKNIHVEDSYAVAVTPDGGNASVSAGGSETVTYTVKNNGTAGATYDLTQTCTETVTGCSLSTASVWIDADTSKSVNQNFSVGAGDTDGTASLTATKSGDANWSDNGSFNVSATHVYSVEVVAAEGTAASAAHGAASTETFTVMNDGSDTTLFDVTVSCSGPLTGCVLSPRDSLYMEPGSSDTLSVDFDVDSVGGDQGTLQMVAVRRTDASVVDTATITLTVVAGTEEAPLVSVGSANPGPTLQRDLCLTAALPGAGIAECGDLRLIHALPTTSTFNKPRTPRLVYSSQHAAPHPVVRADVSFSDTAAVPREVTAVLTVDGTQVAQAAWPDSVADWSPGRTRRIALGFDATGYGTGLYDYALEVTAHFDSTSATGAVQSGELAVVDRSGGPFGAGWWLAGWERLHFHDGGATILWVGGDGSTRKYSQVVTDSVWAAPSHERPDTLKKIGSQYVRELPGGVEVRYGLDGIHVETENRLGHTTVFADTAGVLTRVSLPVPGTAPPRQYVFAYAGGVLDSVAAPDVEGLPRGVQVTASGGTVTSLRDPDGRSVSFGYSGSRVTSRTDRRGTITEFHYDGAAKVDSAHLFMGGGTMPTVDDIVVTLRSPEIQGLAPSAVAPGSVYALLDGPRAAGVGDTTAFHLDRFGMPTRVRNALGHETLLARDDPDFPALVTRVEHPNGRVVSAVYDAHGHLTSTTDSSVFEPGAGYATTRYAWDDTWDAVTKVVPPEKDSVVMHYDASTGNRLWQQDARGSTSRVDFLYYTSTSGDFAGMMKGVQQPGAANPSDLDYDTYGNLASVTTPEGFTTDYQRDDVGRVEIETSPIDATHSQETKTWYDRMGRVDSTQSIGPAMNGAPEQTLTVDKAYNAAGQDSIVSRSSSPDAAGVGTITTEWRYDRAGRPTREIAPDDKVEQRVYDPAGNLTERITRRGKTITMTYDALNRLKTKVVPKVTYDQHSEGIPSDSSDTGTLDPGYIDPYPAYPNMANEGYRVAAETMTYGYDVMGNLVKADNSFAKVDRVYNADGTLRADTLRIRTWSGTDFSKHIYGIEYGYDLNRRRIWMKHPEQLAPRVDGEVKDSVGYAYTGFGALQQVTDVLGKQFQFEHDARGQLDTLRLPGLIKEGYDYDDDGRLTRHTVWNSQTGWLAHPTDKLLDQSMSYDQRGKVLSRSATTGPQHSLTAEYDGLGHLVHSEKTSHAWNLAGATTENTITSDHAYDGLGNRHSTSSITDLDCEGYGCPAQTLKNGGKSSTFLPGVGRLVRSTYVNGRQDTISYDADGNVEFLRQTYDTQQGDAGLEDRASYYRSDGKLAAADYRTFYIPMTNQQPSYGSEVYRTNFVEYGYDALGRRVLVRERRFCIPDAWAEEMAECDQDLIRRTVWDGERELWEIQMPGDPDNPYLEKDTTAVQRRAGHVGSDSKIYDENPYYGRVAYSYGGAIDRPLSITRVNYADNPWGQSVGDTLGYKVWEPFTIVPLWNAQGQAYNGSFGNGHRRKLRAHSHPDTIFAKVLWPAGWDAYSRTQWETTPDFWHGTLINDKRDNAGLNYRRNRYYDPVTGQFTQEDPIGLAGGMNLYGFNDGDPVNLSDPFGLCPVCYIIFEVGATLYDVGDLGLTTINFARGEATGTELGITVTGALAGIVLPGGGFGKAAREVLENVDLIGGNLKNFKRIKSGRLGREGFYQGTTDLSGGRQGAEGLFRELTGASPSGDFSRITLDDGKEIIFRTGDRVNEGVAAVEVIDPEQSFREIIKFK